MERERSGGKGRDTDDLEMVLHYMEKGFDNYFRMPSRRLRLSWRKMRIEKIRGGHCTNTANTSEAYEMSKNTETILKWEHGLQKRTYILGGKEG